MCARWCGPLAWVAATRRLQPPGRPPLRCMLSLIVLSCGCAAAPPWQRGFLDEISEYYDQGVGGGSTVEAADRNAQIALVAFRHGIQIRHVTEDSVDSFSRNGDELIFEFFRQGTHQTVTGTLPAGSHIAERWRAQEGYWWSYALCERPGKGPRIHRLEGRGLQMARRRAVVPGWSQFTKKQERKGWAIITGESLGLAGWLALDALTAEYRSRRGQATPADYRYYDRWTKRFAWGAAGCASLAAATYVFSTIDGITSRPPAYRLLMSQVHLEVQPGAGYLVFALPRAGSMPR